ncbi:MAG: hypothetical protein J0L92_10140 [Deltaproteobacteria bacterium]|nr:hypothetical protein [Deltaproteobacteria bacterium]
MSLEAIALVRLPDHASGDGVVVLSDAVLIKTGASFAAEPLELATGLRRLLGETLDRHDDERGVFFVPAVALDAAKSAGSYAAVIEAIGEAGMWIALVEDGTTARPTMVEALMARAMDGEEIDPEAMQGAVRASLASLAEQFAVGEDDELEGEGTNPGAEAPMDLMALLQDPAMMALAQKMRDLMPPMEGDVSEDDESDDGDDDLDREEPTDGVGTELDGALPPDLASMMSSPAFAEMLKNAQEILAKNPEQAAQLAARFGLVAPSGDDDEE